MPHDKQRQLVGWGSGHRRPTAGLRVRMTRDRGLKDKGVGTVVRVMAASGPTAQPACRVRWDDGSVDDYFTGMTVSRDAVGRASHPHYDTSALERWLEQVGWGQRGKEVLSTFPIREILEMGAEDLHKHIRPGRKLVDLGKRDTTHAGGAPEHEKQKRDTTEASGAPEHAKQKQVRWYPSSRVESETAAPPTKPSHPEQSFTETRFTVRAYTPSAVAGALNRECVHESRCDRVHNQRSDGGDKIKVRLIASAGDLGGRHRQLEKDVDVIDNGDGTYSCSFKVDEESAEGLAFEMTEQQENMKLRLPGHDVYYPRLPTQVRVLSDAGCAHARLEVRINGRHADGSPFPVAVLGARKKATHSETSEGFHEEVDDLEDFRTKANALQALCRQLLHASTRPAHRTRLHCHTAGPGHDFTWQAKRGSSRGSGSSLPLEIAS